MNTRSLRKRLDRLTREKSVNEQHNAQTPNFSVDPVLAKALRDDLDRCQMLDCKRWAPSKSGGPLTAADLEEEQMLLARILERTSKIDCPPGYGLEQFQNDNYRLWKLHMKCISPPPYGGLNEAEKAEEAQLTARVRAYPDGPDARGRQRMSELYYIKDSERSAAEQTELDRLVLLHPAAPPDPNTAGARSMAHNWDETIEQSEEWNRKMEERRFARKNSQSSPVRSNKTEPLRSNKTDDRDEIEKLIVKLGGPGAGA